MTRKLIISLLACLFCSLGARAQEATDADVQRARFYLLSGDYEKCVAMADTFMGYSLNDTRIKAYAMNADDNLRKQLGVFEYKYSDTPSKAGYEAIYMFEEYLKSCKINEKSTDESVHEFFSDTYLAACTATLWSQYLGNYPDAKKFYKMSCRFIDRFYKRVYPKRALWADNPLLQIEILYMAFQHADKLDEINRDNLVDEIWRQMDRLVAACRADGNKMPLLLARGMMATVPQTLSVLAEDFSYEKRAPYYGAVLNSLLRLRNLTLYINGCERFTNYSDVTWEKVRDALGPGEYCIDFFDEPTLKGMSRKGYNDLSYDRHYTFVFTRGSDSPDVIWSPNEDLGEIKDFSKFKEDYKDLKLIYTTGTDEMAYRDFVRMDKDIYRMHTLTDLYTVPEGRANDDMVVFADIDFDSDADSARLSRPDDRRAVQKAIAGSDELLRIDTDEQLIDSVRSTYPKARVFSGSRATHDELLRQMPKAKILHIYTHGIFDEAQLARLNAADPIGGMTGDNALRACKLALAGYNDDPEANCVTADEIRHLDLSGVELVVLDACETNAGQQLAGGAYNLAEAFYMAGAQKIVATLDPIDAEMAKRFTTNFYQLLKKGKSYHDAFYLANAYARVEKTAERFWQSFQTQRIILWE